MLLAQSSLHWPAATQSVSVELLGQVSHVLVFVLHLALARPQPCSHCAVVTQPASPSLHPGSHCDVIGLHFAIVCVHVLLHDAASSHSPVPSFLSMHVGCGAFQNPAPIVAAVYKEEVLKRKTDFEVVAFAVFNAGYGNDNFGVFRDILGGS